MKIKRLKWTKRNNNSNEQWASGPYINYYIFKKGKEWYAEIDGYIDGNKPFDFYIGAQNECENHHQKTTKNMIDIWIIKKK